jgi:hypothetical protein
MANQKKCLVGEAAFESKELCGTAKEIAGAQERTATGRKPDKLAAADAS